MGAAVETVAICKSLNFKCFEKIMFFFLISVPSSDCCESSLVAQIVTKAKELGKI